MREIFQGRKIEFYFCASFSIVIIFLAFALNPFIVGDGPYYYGMLYALYENASPAFTPDVVEFVRSILGIDLSNGLSKSGLDGKVYGLHFWVYSLLCLPAYFLTDLLGFNGLKSFQITNAFILSFVLFYVLFCSCFSAVVRWAIAIVFIFSTGLIYFQWTHPEVYTAAGVLVSSMLAIKRRCVESIIFASFASLQNPSVIFIVIPIIFYELYFLFLERKEFKEISKVFCFFIFSLMPATIPYLWNIIKFGSYNPIADSSYIVFENINSYRFFSFIFDLNQGLVVGVPFLFWVFAFVLVLRIFYFFWDRSSIFKREDVLLLGFVLMIMPTLAQTNWNPGQSIFLRYAAWAGMALLVWAAYTISNYKYGIWCFLFVPALVIQVSLFLYLRGFNIVFHPSYLNFMPWVESLWNINPHFYNPSPEIFYERLKGREDGVKFPEILKGKNGEILRVLTDKKEMTEISRDLCGEARYLTPIDGRSNSNIRITETESGMYYVTGRFICEYKEEFPVNIEISSLRNDNNDILLRGWSGIENWGVWSNGNSAEIRIKIKEKGRISLKLLANVFVNNLHRNQRINIYLNGDYLNTWDISYPYTSIEEELIVDSDDFNGDELLFQFNFPDAKSPKELNISEDERLLSLGLRNIILNRVGLN